MAHITHLNDPKTGRLNTFYFQDSASISHYLKHLQITVPLKNDTPPGGLYGGTETYKLLKIGYLTHPGDDVFSQNDTSAGCVTRITDWSPVIFFHAARMASTLSRFSWLSG